MSQASDMSLANVADSVIQNGSKDVLKKFHWAVKQVANEDNSDDKETNGLTQDELVQLIRAWEPKQDIICLYVRWARQLRRNFNLDSIATLLCLSRQCEYTPVDFLRKVKMLSVYKNQQSTYGVAFQFDVPNRKDINRERLNKEFLGLSVTLALLQEQVTDSPSVLGKTGMRQRGPRQASTMKIQVNGSNKSNKQASIVTHPNVEFHTQSSLLNRIWLSIKHRWVALFLIEHLFREPNVSWLYQDALVYSFQMMAPCGPGRFEFLSPLAGYCFQFRTQESIEAKRSRLTSIWNDPSSFLSYGNTCLSHFSAEAKARIIVACFQDLSSEIPTKSKQISYHRDQSLQRRWNILRAYVFHFWLDAASNNDLKATVIKEISLGRKRKQKEVAGINDNTKPVISPDHISTNTTSTQVPPPCTTSQKRSKSGLHSITSTRRRNEPSSTSTLVDADPTHIFIDGKIGKTKNQASHNTVNEQVHCNGPSLKDINFTNLRLIALDELQQFIQSYLLIHRLDGIDILSELSPFEVYSANHLHDLIHCRLTACSPFYPSGQTGVVFHIHAEVDRFIDTSAKSLHVAREQSEYFDEHAHLLPSMQQIKMLCQAIVCHGYMDCKRAVGQFRVNIGNGGQNWVNGSPCELHGMQFERDLKKTGSYNTVELLQAIGQITEFTWRVMCSMQNDAMDHPIAPDSSRKLLYASHLNRYLSMDDEVGFEDLTLVVSSLYPTIHEVASHKDTMNDTVAGYTRTGAFNLVMISDDDGTPTIIHFQVICNFRKVIGHYVIPFHNYLSPVAKHCRDYLARLRYSLHSVYAGKSDSVPTEYNRSLYFLDDTLGYTMVQISEEGKHKQSISAEYILTEVNTSRTLSLSMFIDPIVKLQQYLKFDQTIELALVCSFLSNPFWFDWTMSILIQRHNDPSNPYQFGLHPFYDWSQTTYEIFGTWQGGPYNRWSPCGGNKATVLETFGAHPSATRDDRRRGENKLSQVISILCNHFSWINSLSNCGSRPVVDMPITMLKDRCTETVKAIANIASCQFSHFRLAILTTIVSGCGLLKEGKHLRNIMYPVKGSASFKHLSHPDADFMSPKRARALSTNEHNEAISNDGTGLVEEDQHDLFMQYLSAELGFRVYCRDEIECILCESHPMRILNCRDWFRKGISLYDCNEHGEFFRREYGRNTKWVKLFPPEKYAYAYLEIPPVQYIPLDAMLSYHASDFGDELRRKQVLFKGRNSRTSSHQRSFTNSYNTTTEKFCHPSLQMADLYLGSKVKKDKIRAMFVLGDAEHAVETACCNDIERYQSGKFLFRYLETLPIYQRQLSSQMAAGCYHKDVESNNDQITFFPGHIDKPFVHTAWFVPIGKSTFFTILSVSSEYGLVQDPESFQHFNEWTGKLKTSDRQKVIEFLQEFDVQAKKHMRLDSLSRLIYLNKCGSVLSFPANQCYHATITPAKPTGYPRDMIVFHPLDGLS